MSCWRSSLAPCSGPLAYWSGPCLDSTLPPLALLRSAAALWITNILVFASWYWRLDAGGPHARHMSVCHTKGDFLFPQMTLAPGTSQPFDPAWTPGFVDYLFLAFNTSTAFLAHGFAGTCRAKMAMMLQSSISLVTLALLAARAVNIL